MSNNDSKRRRSARRRAALASALLGPVAFAVNACTSSAQTAAGPVRSSASASSGQVAGGQSDAPTTDPTATQQASPSSVPSTLPAPATTPPAIASPSTPQNFLIGGNTGWDHWHDDWHGHEPQIAIGTDQNGRQLSTASGSVKFSYHKSDIGQSDFITPSAGVNVFSATMTPNIGDTQVKAGVVLKPDSDSTVANPFQLMVICDDQGNLYMGSVNQGLPVDSRGNTRDNDAINQSLSVLTQHNGKHDFDFITNIGKNPGPISVDIAYSKQGAVLQATVKGQPPFTKKIGADFAPQESLWPTFEMTQGIATGTMTVDSGVSLSYDQSGSLASFVPASYVSRVPSSSLPTTATTPATLTLAIGGF